MTVYEQIKRARLAAGLTQVDLAKRSGLTQSAVSRFESGTQKDVALGTLIKLATALGKTVVLTNKEQT